jgi:hypothetical protein
MQCLGDFQKRINCNRPFSALNLADINRVQVSLFRQFFLAQARLLAAFTNAVAYQFPVFWLVEHKPLQKRRRLQKRHKLAALVLFGSFLRLTLGTAYKCGRNNVLLGIAV